MDMPGYFPALSAGPRGYSDTSPCVSASDCVARASATGPRPSTSTTQELTPAPSRSLSQAEARGALEPFVSPQDSAVAPSNPLTTGRVQAEGPPAPVSDSSTVVTSELVDTGLQGSHEGLPAAFTRAENETREDSRAGVSDTPERAVMPPVLPGTPAGGAGAGVVAESAGQGCVLQSSGRERVLSYHAIRGEGASESGACLYPSVGASMTGRDLFLLEMWLAPELCRDLQAAATLPQLRRQLLSLWAEKLTAEQRAVYDEVIVRRYIEERQGVEEWHFHSVRPWWDRQ